MSKRISQKMWVPPTAGWPDVGLTVALAGEYHMGSPLRPMKGLQRHPEAVSRLINRPADESSFSEINNMTVATHNYRDQQKLASPWWHLNVWEINEITKHTYTRLALLSLRENVFVSWLFCSSVAFLSSGGMSFRTCTPVEHISHLSIYQRLEYHHTSSSTAKPFILSFSLTFSPFHLPVCTGPLSAQPTTHFC